MALENIAVKILAAFFLMILSFSKEAMLPSSKSSVCANTLPPFQKPAIADDHYIWTK